MTTFGGAIVDLDVGVGVGVARTLTLFDPGEELLAGVGPEELDELAGALDDDAGVVISD